MFSKNKLTSTNKNSSNSEVSGEVAKAETTLRSSGESKTLHSAPKSKPAVSSLSTDLVIKGNIQSTGDIQIEGTVEGDISVEITANGITKSKSLGVDAKAKAVTNVGAEVVAYAAELGLTNTNAAIKLIVDAPKTAIKTDVVYFSKADKDRVKTK